MRTADQTLEHSPYPSRQWRGPFRFGFASWPPAIARNRDTRPGRRATAIFYGRDTAGEPEQISIRNAETGALTIHPAALMETDAAATLDFDAGFVDLETGDFFSETANAWISTEGEVFPLPETANDTPSRDAAAPPSHQEQPEAGAEQAEAGAAEEEAGAAEEEAGAAEQENAAEGPEDQAEAPAWLGALSSLAPMAGSLAGAAIGGPLGSAGGGALGGLAQNLIAQAQKPPKKTPPKAAPPPPPKAAPPPPPKAAPPPPPKAAPPRLKPAENRFSASQPSPPFVPEPVAGNHLGLIPLGREHMIALINSNPAIKKLDIGLLRMAAGTEGAQARDVRGFDWTNGTIQPFPGETLTSISKRLTSRDDLAAELLAANPNAKETSNPSSALWVPPSWIRTDTGATFGWAFVEPNEWPAKFAQNLGANARPNWFAELRAANPNKPSTNQNFLTWSAGEKIWIPQEWPPHPRILGRSPTANPSMPLPTSADPAVMLQSQFLLANWTKTHQSTPVPDFGTGSTPTDFSGVLTPRTQKQLAAFQQWANGQGISPALRTDGALDEPTYKGLLNLASAITTSPQTPAAQPPPTAPPATTPPLKENMPVLSYQSPGIPGFQFVGYEPASTLENNMPQIPKKEQPPEDFSKSLERLAPGILIGFIASSLMSGNK